MLQHTESYDLTDWVLVFQDPAGEGYGVSGGSVLREKTPVASIIEGEGVQIVFDSLARWWRLSPARWMTV